MLARLARGRELLLAEHVTERERHAGPEEPTERPAAGAQIGLPDGGERELRYIGLRLVNACGGPHVAGGAGSRRGRRARWRRAAGPSEGTGREALAGTSRQIEHVDLVPAARVHAHRQRAPAAPSDSAGLVAVTPVTPVITWLMRSTSPVRTSIRWTLLAPPLSETK
jgi:hypothetical protein